jgi:hypothetical protein
MSALQTKDCFDNGIFDFQLPNSDFHSMIKLQIANRKSQI